MRLVSMLLLMALMSPTFSNHAHGFTVYVGFTYVKIPPLSLTEDSAISYSASFGKTLTNKAGTVKAWISNNKTNNIPYCFESVDFIATRKTGSFVVPRSLLNASNNAFRFDFYDGVSQLIDSVDLSSFTKKANNIVISKTGESYTSPYCFAYSINGVVHYESEQYTFANFNQYVEDDYYSRIDISNYEIGYTDVMSSANMGFTYANLVLLQADSFPHLGVPTNDVKRVAINVYKSGTKYRLAYANTLYVNPLTRDMSDTLIDGYVQTNYVYLPRGEFSHTNYTFGVEIYGVGYNKSSITFLSHYTPNADLIGDCTSSKYCIGVNSTTPDFELGNIKEVNHD